MLNASRTLVRRSVVIAGIALALLVSSAMLHAAQPVMRLFTTEDGLVRNWVLQIRQDHLGRLWFCTTEGLSLFDGEKFTNYTTADGLPSNSIYDFLDAGNRGYWIITSGGLFRFRARGNLSKLSGPLFVDVPLEGAQYPMRYSAAFKSSLLQTRSGEIWVATNQGLFRVEERDGAPRGILVPINQNHRWVGSIAEDRNGNLWISLAGRLFRRSPDGRISSWGEEGALSPGARTLMEDRQGRLWVGGAAWSGGLVVMDISHERPIVVQRFSGPPAAADVRALFQDANDDIWVAGRGVARLRWKGQENWEWTTYEQNSLIGSQDIASVGGDTRGNLWLALGSIGVARMLRSGLSTFDISDGLQSLEVLSIFQALDGQLYAVTRSHVLNKFDGQRFTAVAPRLPPAIKSFGWGIGPIILQDRHEEWWVATGDGLVRYPQMKSGLELARTPPKAIYGPRNGLPGKIVLRLLEDRQGRIWAGLYAGLACWDPAAESFRDLTPAIRAVAFSNVPTPVVLTEDATGQIWMALDDGALLRYRAGSFERIGRGSPLYVNGILVDHQNRLWIASAREGLGRIDNPADPAPVFRWYTTADGLSSSQLFAVAEDHVGRIYVSGGHGVDRLEPASGVVQQYVTSDGLPPGDIGQLFCDRQGAMWFGSDFGLSRHEPESDRPVAPPSPLIHSVRAAGQSSFLSDDGASGVDGIELPAGKEDIEITYGSVDFSVNRGPRYQYRLLPVDHEWRRPTAVRSVQYPRLGSGRYTFQVRGVKSTGMVSDQIASVAFRIPPPLWQRWWFVLSSAGALFMLGYLAYAYRLRHTLAVQQIRTRLATDLHDDLGSGLAEIAILAEVAKQKAHSDEADAMETVAERARELRAAMGDIVWSVDPACDNLTGVIRRWRQAAAGLLGGVSLAFTSPPEVVTDAIEILPDRRRHLLLLFKEAITNVARHAAAAHVSVDVWLEASRLVLRIGDDGRGFHPAENQWGNGLRSLAHRTEELKGKLDIRSEPGGGAVVELDIPLARAKPHIHAVVKRAAGGID